MARTYLLWGPAGTGKTTFAIDGASEQNPVWYAELEPGGFRRAATRLNLSEAAIQVEKFPTPDKELQTLLEGIPTVGGKGGLHADLSYKLEGWTELLNELVRGFMKAAQAGKRPVLDTATRFWYIIRQAYEQMVQQATGKDSEALGQLRYTWPNKIMLQCHEFPLKYDLDVVWIAHQDTVFNSDPPIYKPDTWKELPGMVDVSLQFRKQGNIPVARIDKGAESGMVLNNLEIQYPTLSKLNKILNLVPLLEREHQEIPLDAELLVNLANLRGL